MIVAAPIARKLVQGRATQIRLPANGRRCPFIVGRDYAVQPHHVDTLVTEETGHESELRQIARSIGRVQIVEIRRGTLGDLTLEDARREGFTTRDEHADTWRRHRGTAAAYLPVWVLRVRPHADPIRLLAPSGSQSRPVVGEHHQDEFSGEEHDYTASRHLAMPHEPEAVDEATLDQFAKDARIRDQGRRSESDADRVERVLGEVRDLLGPQARDDVRVIERRLQAGLSKRSAA